LGGGEIKIKDFVDKAKLFFVTMSFSSWAMLTTWLHLIVPQKYMKNEFTTHFKH
jgi:hypothetical protein